MTLKNDIFTQQWIQIWIPVTRVTYADPVKCLLDDKVRDPQSIFQHIRAIITQSLKINYLHGE